MSYRKVFFFSLNEDRHEHWLFVYFWLPKLDSLNRLDWLTGNKIKYEISCCDGRQTVCPAELVPCVISSTLFEWSFAVLVHYWIFLRSSRLRVRLSVDRIECKTMLKCKFYFPDWNRKNKTKTKLFLFSWVHKVHTYKISVHVYGEERNTQQIR